MPPSLSLILTCVHVGLWQLPSRFTAMSLTSSYSVLHTVKILEEQKGLQVPSHATSSETKLEEG